jgi:hypothetical protein
MDVSQLHAPASLPSGKRLWSPLARRLGGPQNLSESCGIEKNLLPLTGIEPLPFSPLLYEAQSKLIFLLIMSFG